VQKTSGAPYTVWGTLRFITESHFDGNHVGPSVRRGSRMGNVQVENTGGGAMRLFYNPVGTWRAGLKREASPLRVRRRSAFIS